MAVVCVWATYGLLTPVIATAQEAVMATTVISPGVGPVTSRINFDEVKPKPATDRTLALPSLSFIDDGNNPRVTSLILQLPDLDLDGVPLASRLGDQRLPAVFRAGALGGPALASPVRGLTLTTTGDAPVSLSFGQMAVKTAGGPPVSPAFAAAAVNYTPTSRLSLTPQVVIPGGSPNAQRSIGTAVRANVVGNLALMTDVGIAGAANTPWAPLATARLVGHWPRVGIESVVMRGTAAPASGASTALVSSQDREAAQVHVQPLPGFTLTALTSVSRPSSRHEADDTTLGSLSIAYHGLGGGQLAGVRQRVATASQESDISSLEWSQEGFGGMTVRYVHRSESESAVAEPIESSSHVEVGVPLLAAGCAGCPDVHAALTAGSISPTDSGVTSIVSGRVSLIDNTALMGETELALISGDGQVLRALRLATEVSVVRSTRLQLSYVYRTGAESSLGQVFEARIVRRVSLGW